MPVLFIGHGSRMNGIEDTQFQPLPDTDGKRNFNIQSSQETIQAGDHNTLVNFNSLGMEAILAIRTP